MRHGLIKMTDANGKVTVETFAARQKKLSRAFQRYARKHGLFTSTVRASTALRNAAMLAAEKTARVV